jgi:hypothetical protein
VERNKSKYELTASICAIVKLGPFTTYKGSKANANFPGLDKLLILVALRRWRQDFCTRLEGFSCGYLEATLHRPNFNV